jgi:hypothetical protein
MFIRVFSYPWSPPAPPIREIPDALGKADKPLSFFLFAIFRPMVSVNFYPFNQLI